MQSLTGKTFVITGASKGIGRAVTEALSLLNTNLALIARSKTELETVQQIALSNGSSCKIFCGDITSENFVNETIDQVQQAFGSIDVLINNAGFGIFKPADEITESDWETVFATNTKGTFLLSKAVMPAMKERKEGHIINIASDVAKRVFSGGALYCASKYAQDAFSMAIRKELRPFKVKVSVVYSGLVDSSFHAEPQGDNTVMINGLRMMTWPMQLFILLLSQHML